MPTPLPAISPPDYGKTLDAFRTGKQDFLEQQKRDLLKEAGGLAAAGNLSGARNKLYSGGDFSQASNVSGEMRAQSAEQRAIQSHARSLDDAKLAKAAKSQELLGNMASKIKTPEQLEQAKAILKGRGLDASSVTFDQLPMLIQQGITTQQAYQNELEERKFAAEEAKVKYAHMHTDRSFKSQIDQQRIAQENSERDYLAGRDDMAFTRLQGDRNYAAGREDAKSTRSFRELQIDVLRKRADAAAAKASVPKPLTEGQSKARNFEGMMAQAETEMERIIKDNGGEPPISSRTLSIYYNTPNWLSSPLLNKREKQFLQAAEQHNRAKLRLESGATIATEESQNEFRTFIPLSDDDMATRRQKQAGRKKAREGIRIQGGYDAPGAPDAPGSNDPSDLSDDDIKAQLGIE